MEFNQKLQELRKKKGLTQEELATSLYVSRTAISKWESGRGYPNIDSLKMIAKFFSLTVDELLSSGEILTIAEEDNKRRVKWFRDLIYGLLDVCVAMLFFLPFFATRAEGKIQSVSLLTLDGVQSYLKTAYIIVVALMIAMGVLTLALQNCQAKVWLKNKTLISLSLSTVSVLLFIITLQPYPTVFVFSLSVIKVFVLIKRQ
jgi:transcriptional regulator with XRE-family HTH domain